MTHEKSLGEIAALAFGYTSWENVPASMRADFQQAADAVAAEVQKRITEQQRKDRQSWLDRW